MLFNILKSKKAIVSVACSAMSMYDSYNKKLLAKTKQKQSLSAYRPNDYLHIHYAVQVYENNGGRILEEWELIRPYSDRENSYFGAAYLNRKHKHVIIAHRGTEFNHRQDWLTNFDLMTRHLNNQEVSAWNKFAKEIIKEHGSEYTYSFTGHSLGGWLAQSCLWKYQDEFVKEQFPNYQDGFAVTLDDPGAKELLEALQPRLENSYKIAVDQLDLTSYLSKPNLINTALGHVGSCFALPLENKLSWFQYHFGYTVKTHRSQPLLDQFNETTGLPRQCVRILDWPKVLWKADVPSSANTKERLLGYLGLAIKSYLAGDLQNDEYTGFFKYTSEQTDDPTQLQPNEQFHLQHGIHYRVKEYDEHVLPLRNMPLIARKFLEDLNGYSDPDRKTLINQLVPGFESTSFFPALIAYKINKREELVSPNLSAIAFRAQLLEFLHIHPQLCQTNLLGLSYKYILQNQTSGFLTNVYQQSLRSKDLLYRLSFQQGIARLYKFLKPTWEEIENIKNEKLALEQQLSIIKSLKLSTNTTVEIMHELQFQEQQLQIAQQSTLALLAYMQEDPSQMDKINSLIATLSVPEIVKVGLAQDVLLNNAYNLKAKIASAQANKELAINCYKKALSLLPNNKLTLSNYAGLLTDLYRTKKDTNFLVEAFQCYQQLYPYLEQFKPEQAAIVYSGMAYNFILLAQTIELNKIDQLHFPNIIELRNQAQTLLNKATKVDSTYVNAHLFLAILNYDESHYQLALQKIDSVLCIQPVHPTGLMRKGFILDKLQRTTEALKFLEHAEQRLSATQKNGENEDWIAEVKEGITNIKARQRSKSTLF